SISVCARRSAPARGDRHKELGGQSTSDALILTSLEFSLQHLNDDEPLSMSGAVNARRLCATAEVFVSAYLYCCTPALKIVDAPAAKSAAPGRTGAEVTPRALRILSRTMA